MENANSGKPEGPEIRDKMEIMTSVFNLNTGISGSGSSGMAGALATGITVFVYIQRMMGISAGIAEHFGC